MTRVVGTQTAVQSIRKMQQLINGPLVDQITALDREGKTLSDSNVWDGPLAIQFRNEWPQINSSLMNTKAQLDQLRSQMDRIVKAILEAGGASG